MQGCFNQTDGTTAISARNNEKFLGLILQAQKQAEELQKTINQLENFDFIFKFSVTDTD